VFDNDHILVTPDLYFWVAVLGTNYWLIEKLETVAWPAWVNIAAHTGLVVFIALILSFELVWIFDTKMDLPGQGYYAVFAVMPLIAMRIAQIEILPAIKRLGPALQLSLIGTLSGLLLLWNLVINLTNSGDPAPPVMEPGHQPDQ
jgi:hypothetical protein